MTPEAATPLDVSRLRTLLAGKRLGMPLEYRETTASTNDDAAALGRQGAPEGTTVIADAQTRGRGRRGRTWVSPPNKNLYVSVLLRPPIAPWLAPQLAIVAGLGALQAVRKWLPGAVLKWPNDVLVGVRKLCGVLTEMTTRDEDAVDFVVVGIGINVNATEEDFPPELRSIATSLRVELGRTVDREAVAADLLEELGREYDRYLASGFSAVRARWEAACGTLGRTVEVDTGSERFTGVAIGLSDAGHLRVRRADNQEEVEVVSGDIVLEQSTPTLR